jgi:glutamine synthetase
MRGWRRHPGAHIPGNAVSRSRDAHAARRRSWGPLPRERSSYRFGQNVFSTAEQRYWLSAERFDRLQATIDGGLALDRSLANAVAAAMRRWARARGATHFSLWSQPVSGAPGTGATALSDLSGKLLAAGGGIAWDPASPPFVFENALHIPTVLATEDAGVALDHKLPLLRAIDALSTAALNALRVLGDERTRRVIPTVGYEQQYFLVDREQARGRPDLLAAGRTLFGPLEDDSAISTPDHVLACVQDAERELAGLGVPVRTGHGEPGRYELAPPAREAGLGCDQQRLTLEVLEATARRHGLVALTHEKPFGGVDGAETHLRWSLDTNEGQPLLAPGATPAENLRFLFFCAAVVKAIETHQGLLRASVATAGQEHRIGPGGAIMSVSLGAELDAILTATARGQLVEGFSLPAADRANPDRISPFAFTGDGFELRTHGSTQPATLATTVFYTVLAEAIMEMTRSVQLWSLAGEDLEPAVREVVADTYRRHRGIVFDGHGDLADWEDDARSRGLLNLRTTLAALPYWIAEPTVRVFAEHSVLSARELAARHAALLDQDARRIGVEAETTVRMARTLVLPAALRQRELIVSAGGPSMDGLLYELDGPVRELRVATAVLDGVLRAAPEGPDRARYLRDRVVALLAPVRGAADRLEGIVADDLWPLPTYAELRFIS